MASVSDSSGVVPQTCRQWPVRAVQIDLARQRESIDTLDRFMAFAASWGFNTVQLYLEGVVRTKSFPYRDASLSYSEQDAARIAECARSHGLAVVPATATIGHAEHFLSCPELSELAEPRRPVIGSHTLCSSNPRTFEFLAGYLADLADIFPGESIHIGGDEAWSFATCPTCMERRRGGAGFADLYSEHVMRIYEIVQSLGRRMWMWDDMIVDYMPQLLETLPRDIVMCHWEYGKTRLTPAGAMGHFNDSARYDALAIYDRLGYDVVICPRVMDMDNVIGFTDYARLHKVYGGLQTIWELSKVFLPSAMTQVAFAGRLWQSIDQKADVAWQSVADELFAPLTPPERTGVRMACSPTCRGIGPTSVDALTRTNVSTEMQWRDAHRIHTAHMLIEQARSRSGLSADASDILEELSMATASQLLSHRIAGAVSRLIDPRLDDHARTQARDEIVSCKADLQSMRKTRSAQWQRYRNDVAPDRSTQHVDDLAACLDEIVKQYHPLQPPVLLEVQMAMMDQHSAGHLQIEVRFAGTDEWQTVSSGVFKAPDRITPRYPVQFPLPRLINPRGTADSCRGQAMDACNGTLPRASVAPSQRNHDGKHSSESVVQARPAGAFPGDGDRDPDSHEPGVPEAVRLTAKGFGGVGVSYLAVYYQDVTLVPTDAVIRTGMVRDVDNLVNDNSLYCHLGNPDTTHTLLYETGDEASIVEVIISDVDTARSSDS